MHNIGKLHISLIQTNLENQNKRKKCLKKDMAAVNAVLKYIWSVEYSNAVLLLFPLFSRSCPAFTIHIFQHLLNLRNVR